MTLTQGAVLLLLLFFFVGGWVFLNVLLNMELEDPDGHARVTGNCGDTMEISFKTRDGRVIETHHWSNGCAISSQCIEATARLLTDKSIEEIKKINAGSIMDEVGRLPETHVHCALLAETTLQKAVDDYQQKLVGNKRKFNP